jgi:hypothetical protein
MISVDRDLTFYRRLEAIRVRFPGMTLGDPMYVRGRGVPKLKEEIKHFAIATQFVMNLRYARDPSKVAMSLLLVQGLSLLGGEKW